MARPGVQTGAKGIRAAFKDATARISHAAPADPPAYEKRAGFAAGEWPGFPTDRLPPECPVIPLGKHGKASFFVDSTGEMVSVDWSEWGKKALLGLFGGRLNYVTWAWPRKSAKGGINGVEVDEGCACLMKAASEKGLFDAAERVRGRGAWATRTGELIWHSGDALWTVRNGKLTVAGPGEIDGIFYPRRKPILEPWQEPVDDTDTPAHEIFRALQTWTWERQSFDPVLLLGWLACAFVGGALEYRPHAAAMGDKGVGKSALNALFKAVLGDVLLDSGNATEAGIRQYLGLDTLPVAIDEFEASEDNRRAKAIVELSRVAYSGGRILRGGQDHKGVEFQARSTFFCSGINLPPLKPQDKSRFAVLNLGRIDASRMGRPPQINADVAGRMILRQLMDAWPRWPKVRDAWREAMFAAGLDGRAQDTYGTLFALANLLLGDEALEEAGFPVTEARRLGELVAGVTANERAEQSENWRACLEHLLASQIEAWKGGEKPTIGGVLDDLEAQKQTFDTSKLPIEEARQKLAAAGLGLVVPGKVCPGPALAVPAAGPVLARIFQGTRWSEGGWMGALKQAPADVVIRDRGGGQVVKINRVAMRCLLVDLAAFDRLTAEREERGDDDGDGAAGDRGGAPAAG